MELMSPQVMPGAGLINTARYPKQEWKLKKGNIHFVNISAGLYND